MNLIEKLKEVGGKLKKSVAVVLTIGIMTTGIVAFSGCAGSNAGDQPSQGTEQNIETGKEQENQGGSQENQGGSQDNQGGSSENNQGGSEQNQDGEITEPEKPENPENPDNPVVEPVETMEVAIEKLETQLEKYGEIEAYDVISGSLYFYANKNGKIGFFKFETEGDLETVEGVNKVEGSVKGESATKLAEFMSSASREENDEFIVIDSQQIPLKGAKGQNLLSSKLGDYSAFSVTSTSFSQENGKISMNVAVVNSYCITLGSAQAEGQELTPEVANQLYENLEVKEIVSLGIPQNRIKADFATQIQTPPVVEPDDPTIDPPVVETLDYSALEVKIAQVIQERFRLDESPIIITISEKEGNMLVMRETSKTITLDTVKLQVADLKSQENIDQEIERLTIKDIVASPVIKFSKSSSDIIVDWQTYSKDGIEGDNIFAQQCGIDNAIMTWVGGLGGQSFANTSTHYGRGMKILVLTEINDNRQILIKDYVLEDATGMSDEEVYRNFFIDGKNYLSSETSYNLGEKLENDLHKNINGLIK